MEITLYPRSTGNLHSKSIEVDNFRATMDSFGSLKEFNFRIEINDGKGEIAMTIPKNEAVMFARGILLIAGEL